MKMTKAVTLRRGADNIYLDDVSMVGLIDFASSIMTMQREIIARARRTP
jgi:hypothetical protein